MRPTDLIKLQQRRRYLVDCRDRKQCTLIDYDKAIAEVDKEISEIFKRDLV